MIKGLQNVKKFNDREELISKISDDLFDGLNLKQISFVKEYIKTNNAAAAATYAGYESGKFAGHRLMKVQKVKDAIAKVREMLVKETEYTHAKCVEEHDQLIYEARQNKQYTAAVKALEQKARVTGHIQDKLNVDFNQKPTLILNMVGIAPPPYAEQLPQAPVDVTPEPQKLDGTKKSTGD